MNKLSKSFILMVFAFFAIINLSKAQGDYKLDPIYFHTFSKDSLKGFDEEAARASAISEQYLGAEFTVRMYQLKRSYINSKYNLWPKPSAYNWTNSSAKPTVVPACTNEDFEASTAGTLTTSGQVTGWTVTRGSHTLVPGGNSCNLNGCCPNPPQESAVFNAPTGYIDPVIGSVYPIFSVFGSTPGDPNGPVNNLQIPQPMFGDKFFRLNSSLLGNYAYSIEKLSKTFAVTSSNALFQFAFISVFSTGHTCCSAGAFQIKLTNASANTVIACPSYSATGPSSSCQNYTVNGINYLDAQTGAPSTVNSGVVFNKWQMSSMDLTSYIGQNITIDIIASDCDASGHYGYVYFDAQCGPMVVYGNSVAYGAGSGSINVPTCGAAGATLCASSGLGPYYWAGPGVNPPFNTPLLSNQCFTTNVSGTFTLFMNPPGSCAPIERVISTTITPAPLVVASAVQAICGSTTAVVTITTAGSATVPSTISWAPNPLTLSPSTTQAVYAIPPGPAPTNVTITVSDNNGCFVTTNINVNPAPPIPTFSIVNVTGASSITCNNFTVNLAASSTYTYGAINYVWSGSAANYTGQSVGITSPGVYTVLAFDPLSLCYSSPINYNIGLNTTPPTSSITPLYQLITCSNSAISTVTATAITPTVNVIQNFYWGNGLGSVTGVNNTVVIIAPPPGTHTYVLENPINGCKVTKTFTVATAVGFPTFTLASPVQSFSIGCVPKNIADINFVNPDTDPPGGAVSFTILAPGATTNYGFTSQAQYTYNLPGTFTAITRDDVTLCETRVPFSIIQNTQAPQREVALTTQTLTCFTPSVVLLGSSTTPNTTYQWFAPGVTPGATYTVNVTANPSNTLLGTYTFVVTDNTNACKNNTPVPMYQNIFIPKALIVPQSGGSGIITCNSPSITLVNQSTTGIPPNSSFPLGGLLIGRLWEGPSPQVPKVNSSNYIAYQPGTYSLQVQDMNNGCYSATVFPVGDGRDYPVADGQTSILDCGAKSATLIAIVSSPVSNPVRYEWYSTAGLINTQTITTFPSNAQATTALTGEYQVVVTNLTNGCVTTGESTVRIGAMSAKFTADNTSGYAPLTVNFTNQSASSSTATGSQGVSTIWNFGNGTVVTTPSIMPVSTVYNQPGTYSVTIYSSKGLCLQDTFMLITVELPSKLEIPNVFTPNGDGSNDVLFLRTANLTEIKVSIYDRWGNLVYEVNSSTGNVEWDGNNQAGNKVAAGTYFYIITSTGKDGKSYDTKGNVSLYR